MNTSGSFAVARYTFNEAIRARLLIVWGAGFFLIAVNLPVLLLFFSHLIPPDYASSNLPTFISETLAFVPLWALGVASPSIVEERNSGTLQYVLSNPLSKADFFLGRMFGYMLATSAVISLGFGAAAVVTYQGHFASYPVILSLVLVALALNVSMLGLALTISTLSRRRESAIVAALFFWVLLTIITQTAIPYVANGTTQGDLLVNPMIFLNPVEIASILGGLASASTGVAGGGGYANLGVGAIYLQLVLKADFGHYVVQGLVVAVLSWVVGLFGLGFIIFMRQDITFAGKGIKLRKKRRTEAPSTASIPKPTATPAPA
jgi:ABC-type transport system involved in multi-copper enzyme maturation permease subunit